MATYAVGDIQGCLKPLKRLLERAKFDPATDKLWVAGDMVNRGPESLETLRFLYNLGPSVTAVLGNHDLHLLAVAYDFRLPGNGDTVDDILKAPDRDILIQWLRQWPLVHHDATLGFTMVHAGIPPQWTIGEALLYSAEVESVLQSDAIEDFLINMYGDWPDKWKDELTGYDRLRVITNYFTRMRFCKPGGKLELVSKQTATEHPPGFAPWFAHPKRKTANDPIVFGHWAALEGKVKAANVYALDTGCVWGGRLSMLRLEDKKWYRCACK